MHIHVTYDAFWRSALAARRSFSAFLVAFVRLAELVHFDKSDFRFGMLIADLQKYIFKFLSQAENFSSS